MKRKIFSTAILLMLVSILSVGTVAFFSDEKVAHNIITSGEIKIELLEWSDKEEGVRYPENSEVEVMPGTVVNKLVEVKNTGANDAYIRVKVDKLITLAQNTEGDPDLGLIKFDFDESNWILKDGYYHYTEALKSGETTEALFATVTFDQSMNNEYQNSTAKVSVTAYGIQVDNNGASALEANGWPE